MMSLGATSLVMSSAWMLQHEGAHLIPERVVGLQGTAIRLAITSNLEGALHRSARELSNPLSSDGAFVLGDPLLITALLVVLAGLGTVILCCTSYLKFSVILALLRNSFGVSGIPSTAVCTALSLLLMVHSMEPVFKDCYNAANMALGVKKESSQWEFYRRVIEETSAPLRAFMERNVGAREIEAITGRKHSHSPSEHEESWRENSGQSQAEEYREHVPFLTLVPAFVLSELTRASAAGLALLLPFIVIDIMVVNVLLALGITMMSPTTLSFPLKLCAFIFADGWFRIWSALLSPYVVGS